MKKLIMLKGLPASGKSSWAKKLQADNPHQYKRVNKDELRAMLDDSLFSGANERFVLALRDHAIAQALHEGKHVIVDDTNLDPKHETRLREIAQAAGAAFSVNDSFLAVSVEECVARDLKRLSSVGERVIRTMHWKYLQPKNERHVVEHVQDLPLAYIFDIDGTLALMNGRGPFEWEKVENDTPNIGVVRLLKKLCSDDHNSVFILVSGRDESCKTQTLAWLAANGILFDELHMRPAGDSRKDAIVKEEIYHKHIEGKFNVLAVFDDRNQTVAKWRELGLTCLQVAEGDF